MEVFVLDFFISFLVLKLKYFSCFITAVLHCQVYIASLTLPNYVDLKKSKYLNVIYYNKILSNFSYLNVHYPNPYLFISTSMTAKYIYDTIVPGHKAKGYNKGSPSLSCRAWQLSNMNNCSFVMLYNMHIYFCFRTALTLASNIYLGLNI